MPKLNPIAISVVCAFSIAGCAGYLHKPIEKTSGPQPVLGIKHGGVTAEAMYRLGRYFEGQDRYDEAVSAYREALRHHPDYAEARSGLGVSLAAKGSYNEAIAEFKAAIAISPESAYLHNNLGYAYLLQGSNEQAVKALEEARRLDPSPERAAHYNLRLAYERIGQAEKARQMAKSDSSAAESEQPVAKPIQHEAQVTSSPRPTIELFEVAPSVYELRAPATSETLDERRRQPQQVRQAQEEAAQSVLKPFTLEVSNGNGVTGMAKRVARFLDRRGYSTTRLTNQVPFQQAATEVQYRSGYGAEAAVLSATLPKQVSVMENNALRSDVHVRVVLGKDLRSDAALFEPAAPTVRIAAKAETKPGQ